MKIVKNLLVRPLFRSVPVDILPCILARFAEQRRTHSFLSLSLSLNATIEGLLFGKVSQTLSSLPHIEHEGGAVVGLRK